MTSDEPLVSKFPVLPPDLQIRFWARLEVIRNELLGDSLAKVIATLDIRALDRELARIVGSKDLAALAAYSLRGEAFYPVPIVLRAKPMLLGYYRLLYGLSQKEFYSKGPFGRFRSMEDQDRLASAQDVQLTALCKSLAQTGRQLFNGIQPVSSAAIHDLQMLTIGPQLRGSENNVIGESATREVFNLVRSLVAATVSTSTDRVITIRNAAGRVVRIAFASDPDIAIVEAFTTRSVPSVSIEIKGGGDRSNVHNRIGEAEKSHQKAKAAGFTQFWTILKANINFETARRESPTTTSFFKLDEIMDHNTSAHSEFRDLLFHTIGIS